jgi:hypothetical protein
MKWPILIAIAAFLMPVTAHAQAQPQEDLTETVGGWELHGKDGECVILKRVGEDLISIGTPSGDGHYGGVAISLRNTDVTDRETATLEFIGEGAWKGPHTMYGVANISGFFTAFTGPDDINLFPDKWRVTLTRKGKVVSDISITGFDTVRAATLRCIETTK